MEVKKSKLLSNTHSFSLPSFTKKAQNNFWFNKFQKEHVVLEKKVRLSNRVDVVFEDIMNMMKINRDYFHSEHRSGRVAKREEHLPKVKITKQITEDENSVIQKLGEMCDGAIDYKFKIKKKQEKKEITAPKKKSIKRKKFALFATLADQPISLQNQLSQFLARKQKQRYRQKVSVHKSILSSCNNSIQPGQYVPTKLIQTLHRKTITSEWEI